MTPTPAAVVDNDLREKILNDPGLILDDRDVMNALVAATDGAMGGNVVDMRGLAMGRLEDRLDRLEDTHRSVIAAAYDNLAGTNMIHRAVLRMLDPVTFEDFLNVVRRDMPEILRVDYVRLILETKDAAPNAGLSAFDDVLVPAPEGFIAEYVSQGRARQDRKITLRQVNPDKDMVFGEAAAWIQSEACLKLDLGADKMPGLLVLGAEDPHQFSPSQGTDLLSFFASSLERAMRRWLA